MLRLLQSVNYVKFLIELRDVSGMTLPCTPDNVTKFLTDWEKKKKIFRQDYKYTWDLIALKFALSTQLYEFDLAVIKRTVT